MRALSTEVCQRNLALLLTARTAPSDSDTIENFLETCDKKYPLRGPKRLPPELCTFQKQCCLYIRTPVCQSQFIKLPRPPTIEKDENLSPTSHPPVQRNPLMQISPRLEGPHPETPVVIREVKVGERVVIDTLDA